MMANQHDRLATSPPLDMVISDAWVLALVTAGCAAVVVWVAVVQ